jgi:hypothetical protein
LPERVGGLALNVVIVIYLVIRLIRRRARQPLVRADGPGQTGCCVGGKQTSFPLCCLDQMARASSVKITVS